MDGRQVARAVVVMMGAALLFSGSVAAQSVHEQIVGVYRLARYAPHGDEPTGRISYDSSGRMWAMIFPPGRPPLGSSSVPEEYRDVMRGVVAYYGTYEIDESTGRVIHHVESASNPAWIGDEFVRWFRFEGPNLVISLNARFDNALLWERLPGPPAGDRR